MIRHNDPSAQRDMGARIISRHFQPNQFGRFFNDRLFKIQNPLVRTNCDKLI
ncbi:MAG: hypothetical protein ACI9EW_000575 [Cellvibrionaceae bacterium]|jgi:hypothetical protein